jgi:NADH:ubiquinone reductase (H+-translocating)
MVIVMTGSANSSSHQVVILGAGYAGLMAALGLSGRNRIGSVALISERDEFVERIRLQEALAGQVPARIPSLAGFLAKTGIAFIRGRVVSLDAAGHCVRVDIGGELREIAFERSIYALGSAVDRVSVPGVSEHAYCLDPGEGERSAGALRGRLAASAGSGLRVVVVGGANTATKVAGEIKSTWPELDVAMVSKSDVGDFHKGSKVQGIVRAELERLGVRLVDQHAVLRVRSGEVVLDSGETMRADVCVWAGGLRAPPIARQAGLAVDDQDRILADAKLSSTSHPHIIAVGDAVHPLAPTGARYRMSAFAAVTTGAYAARRIAREAKGRSPRPFSFSAYGQGVAIGKSGVGFTTFPNDGDAYFLLRGSLARHVRNLFVRALVLFLKLERLLPGSALFWIGRRRVSWTRAREMTAFASEPPGAVPITRGAE